jgi:hypothetical protein
MRLSITLIILLAAALSAGCRQYPKATPVEERIEFITPDNAQALRAAYRQQYPNSQLGIVAAAINHQHGRFVAVGDLPLDQMAVGQLVTFIDVNQKPLTTGTIVNVLPDSIHVRVDDPPLGSREPRVGDMMIRF